MKRTLYEMVLGGLLVPADVLLTEDAKEYIVLNLDVQYEDAVRHVIRHTLVPAYRGAREDEAQHAKDVLEWFLNCATDSQREGFLAQDPEWPVDQPEPARLFFEWWWAELFGDEDWRSDRLCDAELYRSNPPNKLFGGYRWPDHIDPAVLHFPRRDGKEPGAGAPAVVTRP